MQLAGPGFFVIRYPLSCSLRQAMHFWMMSVSFEVQSASSSYSRASCEELETIRMDFNHQIRPYQRCFPCGHELSFAV